MAWMFSLVAKLSSVQVILSLAANLDQPLYQMYANNAFLHEDVQEEVSIELPPRISLKDQTDLVYQLKTTMYELNQSPQAWFNRFSRPMLKNKDRLQEVSFRSCIVSEKK